MFLGIAAIEQDNGSVDVSLVSHDGTYNSDFAVETFSNQSSAEENAHKSSKNTSATRFDAEELSSLLADYFVTKVRDYEQVHDYKFVGVGMTSQTALLSPGLPAKLWSELDIVPLIFEKSLDYLKFGRGQTMVDEEADSMVRKCLR
jgi:alpha,alpha-trehalose phosphorylase (configuration-retaining)